MLLGLRDRNATPSSAPLWFRLLRLAAVAFIILGFSGPVLNPSSFRLPPGESPVAIVLDGSWAEAEDWGSRIERARSIIREARNASRPVALVLLSDHPGGVLDIRNPEDWLTELSVLQPNAWEPDESAVAAWLQTVHLEAFDTFWFTDGLHRPGRDTLIKTLESFGQLKVVEADRNITALRPPSVDSGTATVTVLRSSPGSEEVIDIEAHGTDPAGNTVVLERSTSVFGPDDVAASAEFHLRSEIRNRIARFQVVGPSTAGTVIHTAGSLSRPVIGLYQGRQSEEGLELLSPLHFLRHAMGTTADLVEGELGSLLARDPHAIVLADVAALSRAETEDLTSWVESGGILLRFAGPRMAMQAEVLSDDDPLMPVDLRYGGRSFGGTMTWVNAQGLRPFEPESPFYGLDVPGDVRVRTQVLALPGSLLEERVLASLKDGTPLVTRKYMGAGQVVLFHVNANAEWSDLPLSQLFIDMLERMAVIAGPGFGSLEPSDLDASWRLTQAITYDGLLIPATDLVEVSGQDLVDRGRSPAVPPGLYEHEGRSHILNTIAEDRILQPSVWPSELEVLSLVTEHELQLTGWLLGLAILLIGGEALASLLIVGKLRRHRASASSGTALAALFVLLVPAEPVAETALDLAAMAAGETRLAFVRTGDARADYISEWGLRGLSAALVDRTTIRTAEPVAVAIEEDEIAYFPLLYWPITYDQEIPSEEAASRINRYLRLGGMIVFDTRDADRSAMNAVTVNQDRLYEIARVLDLPELEPLPRDHVLTRSFYLLADFPGRHVGGPIVVEATTGMNRDEALLQGTKNDGVTPVVIGGNDWASAWAAGPDGRFLFPIGRDGSGERQREAALRFGINLVMHALTGNYKSDQLHIYEIMLRLTLQP